MQYAIAKTNAIVVPKVGNVTSVTAVTNLVQCKDRLYI